MDYEKLRKPDHIREDIWRQRLHWMKVVGGQMEENFRRQQRQSGRAAPSQTER